MEQPPLAWARSWGTTRIATAAAAGNRRFAVLESPYKTRDICDAINTVCDAAFFWGKADSKHKVLCSTTSAQHRARPGAS